MSAGVITSPNQGIELSEGDLRAQLGPLGDRPAREQFLDSHPELTRTEIVTRLAELVPRAIQTSPSEAMAFAECAVSIARRLHDTGSMALALRAKANVLHMSGKNRAAVNHHDRARSLFLKLGDQTQLARTLSASIQPLILIGEYERAYAAAAEASSIFREQGNEWRLARVELNAGNIYDRQDRFEEALACYERAYQCLLPYQDRDPESVAVALHNMAGCLVLLNEFHRAVATYERARAFAAETRMPLLVAQADYNIAWLHYLRGEYGQAIAILRATRDACASNHDQHHYSLCHLDLSEIYLELNMPREAEMAAEVAQQGFGGLGTRYEQAKAWVNLAIAQGQRGKAKESREAFARARDIFVTEKNKAWCSLIDLYQAIAMYDQRCDAEARQLASAALHYFSGAALLTKAVLCHLLLTRLFLRANRIALAFRECTRALKVLKKLESPTLDCQVHALMAQIQRSLGRMARSYAHYQQAKEALERLRSGIRGEELKISFMRDRVEIYEGLVDLCMNDVGGGAREALGYMEQAKSRALLDTLSAVSGGSEAKANDENKACKRVRELREELNWYYHRSELEQFSDRENKFAHVQRLRAETRERERELLDLLREQSGEGFQGGGLQAGSVLDVEAIQTSLSPCATILEYFRVRDRFVAVLITQHHLELVPVCDVATVDDAMMRLRFQVAKLRLGPEYIAAFEEALQQSAENHLWELHQALVAPIRSRLKTPHLIIVPHGSLHHLPFQALFDGQNYLIDNFTISYAPSASVYALCASREPREGKALILAIPDPAIPQVEEEVVAVAQMLPDAELIIGAQATSAVLAEKGRGCRFIHIATHGHFRQDQPMFSGIRLADSHLSLYDLYQLRLPAELVTLSGCSTGVNVVSAGDEILGLVRGLICAGAQASLLTLWDVQDQSTSEFMKAFYGGLVAGRNKAEALRDAVLRLRKSHPHPYYWAPFVLVGKVFRDSES